MTSPRAVDALSRVSRATFAVSFLLVMLTPAWERGTFTLLPIVQFRLSGQRFQIGILALLPAVAAVARVAALSLGGQMTPGPFEQALSVARETKAHLQRAGYPFSDPIYSLLFLTADFLPGPRLTWSGVLDVRTGRIIHEAEPLDP